MHLDSAANRHSFCCGGKNWRQNTLLFFAVFLTASMTLAYRYHVDMSIVTIRNLATQYISTQLSADVQRRAQPVNYSLANTGSYGYIVSNAFSGQQGSGVRALLSLQCWAASFALPMFVVEPYIEKSSLSTRRKNDIMNTMTFGDFFDLQHFNNLSISQGRPPLVQWRTFLHNAPRQAIVARIHNDYSCHRYKEFIFKVMMEEESEVVGGCHDTKWLNNPQLQEMQFCVVRVVILRGCLSRPDAIKKMYKVLFGEWAPEQVTLVLRMWAANWDKLQKHDAAGSISCRDNDGHSIQHRLWPSPRLLQEAQYYTSAYLNSHNRVAVMIRSEQAIRGFPAHSGDRLESLRVCLDNSTQIAKILAVDKQNPNGSISTSTGKLAGIYLTLDVGSYGSNSMDWVLGLEKYNLANRASNVIDMVKGVVHKLYDGKWDFQAWEKSFIKATDEAVSSGYIASLQRTIASQAECLILMGGGDYQRLALIDYLENHPDPAQLCVHFVCMTKAYEMQFSNLVQETYNVTSLPLQSAVHPLNVIQKEPAV